MRLSELLSLTWDAIDLKHGTLNINKQLSRPEHRAERLFLSPKNGKIRIITVASYVIGSLRCQKVRQTEMKLKAGLIWNNQYNLVFTTEDGGIYEQSRATNRFSFILSVAGLEGERFRDLRYTYAVNSIRAGDDIKTIQGNLGHATVAFTLDRYGHFTEQMKQDSTGRMESFIKYILNL